MLYRAQAQLYAHDHEVPFQVATQRLEWQRLAPGLQQKARELLGSSFGGVWVDPDSSRIKLGIATPNPAMLTHARGAVADSGLTDAADIVQVPRSEAELNDIADWISARFSSTDGQLTGLPILGILPDHNAVEISLPRDISLTGSQQQILDEARQHYDDAITIDLYDGNAQLPVDACGYPFCPPPLRAGVKIGPSASFLEAPEGLCTAGFLARGKEGGKLYQLTAGHCDSGAVTWGTRPTSKEAWHEIGAWANSYRGVSGDAGIFEVSADSFWHARPWVYWAGLSESYPIYSDADPVKGQEVCKSGAFYGDKLSCGEVTAINVEANVGGVVSKNFVRASYCRTSGDSGAPVHYYGVAYGLHISSFSNCDALFTPIHAAEEVLKVNVRHESECDPLFESPVKIGDMTGDGKEDVLQFPGGGKGNAWESKGTSYSSLGEIGSGFGSAYQDRVGDMDGDGDDDIFQMTDNGDLYTWESKGSSYASVGKVGEGFGSACDTRIADINGDGKTDILRFTNDGYGYGWLAIKGGYESLGQVGTGFGATYQDRTGDMNGDGDDDLFQIDDNGKVFKWDSNGSSYSGGAELFSGVGNASQVRFADLEGDGDDDIFRFTDSGVGSLWKSKGTSFEAIGSVGTEFGLTRQMRVADIDGDGDTDILKFADDGKVYAWTYSGGTYTSKGNIGSGFGKP